jgi:hypothetical protein
MIPHILVGLSLLPMLLGAGWTPSICKCAAANSGTIIWPSVAMDGSSCCSQGALCHEPNAVESSSQNSDHNCCGDGQCNSCPRLIYRLPTALPNKLDCSEQPCPEFLGVLTAAFSKTKETVSKCLRAQDGPVFNSGRQLCIAYCCWLN